MSGYLRDVGSRPARPARDPMGKAALFSDATGSGPAEAIDIDITDAPDPAPSAPDVRKPGTVVIECSACGTSTRVSYVDFALSNLPFSLWLPPLPALHFNRRMTCPTCAEWAWVRAHWLA